MGNTASTTRGGDVPSKNVKLIVKPPQDWNAQTEEKPFVVVSPHSDISNPSQIRHPAQRSKTASMTTKTPMRKRTSKVVSKGLPPSHRAVTTSLPAPQSFYFEPSSTVESSDPAVDSENNVAFQQGNGCLPQNMKKKATRAKKLLKGCWKEQKESMEGCYRNKNITHGHPHQRFKSMSPSRNHKRVSVATNQSAYRNTGAQFIPEIEEEELPEQNTMSPRQVYLHDEEDYLQRIQTQSNPAETPYRAENVANAMDQAVPTNAHENSPVAKLFGRGYHSDTGLPAVDSAIKEQTPARHSYPEKMTEVARQPREPNTVERHIQRQIDTQLQQQSPPSAELSMSEPIYAEPELRFESKSKEIGRVKRLRESYLQKLESTRRLSEAEESRRKSVEDKLNQMRQGVIAEEFSEQLISREPKEPTSPFDEPKEVPRRVSLDEEREYQAPRGRASAPVQRSTNAVQHASKPARKSEPVMTKISQPQKQTSKGLPVLLKMAGWEQALTMGSVPSKPQKKQGPQLPAVLALAGWKQQANRKNPPPRKSTTFVKPNVTEDENSMVVANPSKTSGREFITVDAQKEDRAIKQAASHDTDDVDEEQRIPLPFNLQGQEPPKDTPVVKKMGRMLMETHQIASVFQSPEELKRYGAYQYTADPNESMDSAATPIGEEKPMLTRDTLVNAAFLFSPGYVDNNPALLRMGEAKSEASTTITTLDSRNRLLPSYNGKNAAETDMQQSVKPTTSTGTESGIYTTTTRSSQHENSSKPHPVLKNNSSLSTRSSDSGERHVRFSIGNKVVEQSTKNFVRTSDESSKSAKSPLRSDNLEVPAIEHKLSDLTDIFSGSEHDSIGTMETQPTIQESIQETPTVQEYEEEQLDPSPPTNWGYGVDMDNGVTPLRSGKGGGPSNATNSVYKRFNQAKSRFSSVSGKASPVKKSSPVKARPSRDRQPGGLVHQRVAAMEEQCSRVDQPVQKTRRDTFGHRAIAPRRANLRSQHFKKTSPRKHSPKKMSPAEPEKTTKPLARRLSISSNTTSDRDEAFKRPSPTEAVPPAKRAVKRWSGSSQSSNREEIFQNLPQNLKSNLIHPSVSKFSYSTASSMAQSGYQNDDQDDQSDTDSDDFGTLRRTSTVEQDEKQQAQNLVKNLVKAYTRTSDTSQESASTEMEDDDFAAILQYQTSVDEEDSESDDEETVSTIQRHRLSAGSSTVLSGGTAPTVVRRTSVGENSATSGGTLPTVVRRSSVQSGSTAPTVARRERDLVGVSRSTSYASYPPTKALPFRDAAPVRPTEQNHRAAPGALVLSPMQRTPMQALKWRALAAAEKEKNERNRLPLRKSLTERNPNVFGH